jgi:hypothetical membrane protein
MGRLRPWAGLSLCGGAAIFWLVNTAAEGAYPAYDVQNDSLSRLGSVGAPTALYWNGAIFLLAACWLIGILMVLRGTADWPWIVGNAVPPLCLFLVGLFPMGSIGAVHNTAAYGGFIAGGVVALADARLLRGPIRFASAALGAFALGCLVVFSLSPLGPAVGFGVAERLVAYPDLVWLMGLGGYVMAGGIVGREA